MNLYTLQAFITFYHELWYHNASVMYTEPTVVGSDMVDQVFR